MAAVGNVIKSNPNNQSLAALLRLKRMRGDATDYSTTRRPGVATRKKRRNKLSEPPKNPEPNFADLPGAVNPDPPKAEDIPQLQTPQPIHTKEEVISVPEPKLSPKHELQPEQIPPPPPPDPIKNEIENWVPESMLRQQQDSKEPELQSVAIIRNSRKLSAPDLFNDNKSSFEKTRDMALAKPSYKKLVDFLNDGNSDGTKVDLKKILFDDDSDID
jgi:hypothetical protein